MRLESYGLETYSPYFDMELTDFNIFDGGDLDLPFGNTERAIEYIYNFSKKIISDNKIPVMIGGEHLVSLSNFKAVYEKYKDVKIIHFDAHADLREEYMDEKLSHATVMRRIWDIVGDDNIYQFGIRSFSKDESEFTKLHVYTERFKCDTLKNIVEILAGNPVYVTIDLDILDPSIFPGTGTIEPGGIFFNDMMDSLKEISKLNIIGGDIVELSPNNDNTGTSTAVACKVLREFLFSILI